jgi:PEGA domain
MFARRLAAITAVAITTLLTGCVERRFRVESNPPGAYLYINNTPYGPTPVDVPFLFYGDYDIELVKEGFQTKRVKEPVPAPWYQYPIADFFSENVWPTQITDIRPLYFEMEPIVQPNLDLLKSEAEELRSRGAALPPPRYPDPRKDKPTDRSVPPGEALPPPRETPALPPPMPGEQG